VRPGNGKRKKHMDHYALELFKKERSTQRRLATFGEKGSEWRPKGKVDVLVPMVYRSNPTHQNERPAGNEPGGRNTGEKERKCNRRSRPVRK